MWVGLSQNNHPPLWGSYFDTPQSKTSRVPHEQNADMAGLMLGPPQKWSMSEHQPKGVPQKKRIHIEDRSQLLELREMAMGQNPVPLANIPIPTKIGSKMGCAPTPKEIPLVLTHSQISKNHSPWHGNARDRTVPGSRRPGTPFIGVRRV